MALEPKQQNRTSAYSNKIQEMDQSSHGVVVRHNPFDFPHLSRYSYILLVLEVAPLVTA